MFSTLLLGLGLALAQAAPPAQVINIGNGAEPKDLDPAIVTGVPEYKIISTLFEPLVGKDPKTTEPIPAVAESWKVSKDGKVWTFKLRKSAKWSNGDSVTAQDFIYSWTRLLKPETAAEYAYDAFYIKGAKDFNAGKLKDPGQLGLKAPDPYTLEVTLESPTPFFLGLLFHHAMSPVHKATIEKFGRRWTRPENIVVNGPFNLDKWEMNKVITLKKSETYWDKEHVALSQVNWYPVENTVTEEKMFRSHELDVTLEVPLEKISSWQSDTSGVYRQVPYLGSYFYYLNTTKPPLNDKRVRKALALSVDREQLVKYVLKGGQLPGTTYTPPGCGGYQPTPRLPKDLSRLAEAKGLLKEAGYPDGKGLPPIEISYNTSDAHRKIAEALQQMWKTNLGLDMRLANQEWKVFLDTQHSLNYQVSRMGWIADYNDPNTFLDMFVTKGGNNNSGWGNKDYDALIAKAAHEQNAKKRLALFDKAEEILLDELPIVPLYIYTRVYLRSPAVAGWYDNVEDIHPLKFVSINPKS